MNKESTLYDYTKSAEELRQFELREKCSKIAMEYERFNLENDVYKMFGEWLLEQAKMGYGATFTTCDLLDYLESKGLSCPRLLNIESEYNERNDCKLFRMISSGSRFYSSSPFSSDYGIYTLWKITKAYNHKNGCVVVDAPSYLTSSGSVAIVLDWSKDAQGCITREKWRSDAKKESPFGLCALFGGLVGAILGFLVAAVLAIIHISAGIIFLAYFGFIAFCAVVIGALSRPIFIDLEIDKQSKDFNTHCKSIEATRYSRYSIRLDEQRDWVGRF